MGQLSRAAHMDVSNSVDVTDPVAVAREVQSILEVRYRGADLSRIDTLVRDLARLYRGDYPGFRACDLGYHNLQHVLDVTLAMARLIDGHDSVESGAMHLGPELAVAGIAAALFHDSGYIRRVRDTRHRSGAAYTRVHVSRSARFLAEYLPKADMADLAGVCTRIVHFTGYERNPSDIQVDTARERRLGELLGTADLIAQMSDAMYAQKCREYLYEEFREGGLAGEHASHYPGTTVFRDPEHLLEQTPGFIKSTITGRLEAAFGSVYRYAATHFDGKDLYMDAIRANHLQLEVDLTAKSAAPAGD